MLAEQLQQALLPKSLPAIDGLDVEVRYSAAADSATVGGDWYDVFRLSKPRSSLVIGDVVGHDTPAAISMSRLRHLINAFAIEAAQQARDGHVAPDDIFCRIDRLIHDDASAWATCVVAIVDTTTAEMRWSSAGHPPPLLLRDGTVRQLDSTSAPGAMLGVTRNARRTTSSMTLFDGDRVMLYTDGLFERRRESLEVGLTRLVDTVRASAGRPLDRFCDEVTAAMFARDPPERRHGDPRRRLPPPDLIRAPGCAWPRRLASAGFGDEHPWPTWTHDEGDVERRRIGAEREPDRLPRCRVGRVLVREVGGDARELAHVRLPPALHELDDDGEHAADGQASQDPVPGPGGDVTRAHHRSDHRRAMRCP